MRILISIVLGLFLCFGALAAWVYWESSFSRKLTQLANSNAEEINLGNIMSGDWELVCDSSGYGGPVRIEKYNKVYPPSGYAQDGYWGLIFISPDGSYKSATGNNTVIELTSCVSRDKAIFYKQPDKIYRLSLAVLNEIHAQQGKAWRFY